MTASNLYATRIYSEHPVGLWPIDDDLTYLSMIDESDRSLLTWDSTASISTYADFYADSIDIPPFSSTGTYKVSGQTGTRDTLYYAEIKSPALFNLYSGLNHEQKVFAVNAYIWHELPAAYYELGYYYNDGTQDVYFTEQIMAGPAGEWIRVGRTFDQSFMSLNAHVFLRVFFPTSTKIEFLFNGLSVGQWSETHSQHSLGVTAKAIARTTGLPSIFDQDLQALELREYGPGTDTGYALVQDHRLLATNGGIPLVYGSDSVTTLIASNEAGIKIPSIVVPGKGFLNDRGRHNNYTLEAWVRLDNLSASSRRIIGPVASNDGIFVKGNSITIAIGDQFKSFCVGEWYRPMLLHMTVESGRASLLINGERVAFIDFDRDTASLPSNVLYNEDWIGFYSWSDVHVFEVDTISIFPYVIPAAVAKRRFVWGQGVESPETINSAYQGTALTVDFAYANYSVNHSYPETARWDSGEATNLIATRSSLSAPDYVLPRLESGRRSYKSVMESSLESWMDSGGISYLTFNDDQPVDPCYLFYGGANLLIGMERTFYGIFSGTSDVRVPLMLFVHRTTGQELRIDIENNVIEYKLDGVVFQTAIVLPEDIYVVGLDFSKAAVPIRNMMQDPGAIEIYIGGDQTNTFTGRIYRFGVFDSKTEITSGDDGVLHPLIDLSSTIANYTLIPTLAFNRFFLDVGVYGKWEESIPLSYFATDGRIDFMQFNMGALSSGGQASGSSVRAYLTFGSLTARSISKQDTIVAADESGVLDLRGRTDYLTSTFSVTNNTVIVPPTAQMRDLIMTLTLEVDISGLMTDAFVMRDLSISAFTTPDDKFAQIGTVHGTHMAPYSKLGNYYISRIDRPWTIYKKSTPYLYLTNDSGIHPLSKIGNSDEAGIWIGINNNRDRDFKISSLQLWVKYSESSVPDEPVELFSVKSDSTWIRFMGVNDGTGLRLRVYSIDGFTGEDFTGIRFHQDGHQVITPYIQSQHWSALGIDFEPLLNLASDIGAVCLISGCIFNNVVFYKTSSLQEQYVYAYRTWAAVKNDGTSNLTWSYWRDTHNGTGATWDEVAKTATISHGISIDEIYKTYVGTNRFVVDDQESMLLFDGGQTTVISSDITTISDQDQTRIAVIHHPEWRLLNYKPV